jgi:hypothetical protein
MVPKLTCLISESLALIATFCLPSQRGEGRFFVSVEGIFGEHNIQSASRWQSWCNMLGVYPNNQPTTHDTIDLASSISQSD